MVFWKSFFIAKPHHTQSRANSVFPSTHVPSRSVCAFFQEGLEKSAEKGSSTDRMFFDRESIGFYRLVLK